MYFQLWLRLKLKMGVEVNHSIFLVTIFFNPWMNIRRTKPGCSKVTINQWLFKHNLPCFATQPQKIPLHLPTQSHLIAQRVCWSVSRRFLCLPVVWEHDFCAMTQTESSCNHISLHRAIYYPAFVCSRGIILFLQVIFLLLRPDFPLFIQLFIYSPFTFWQCRCFLQANNKSCDCDRNWELESQSAAAFSSFLFIMHTNTF